MSIHRDDSTDPRLISLLFKSAAIFLFFLSLYLAIEILNKYFLPGTNIQITLSGVIYSIVAIVLFSLSAVFFCVGRSYSAMSAFEMRKHDPRDPVLFLRSFQNDARNTSLFGNCFSQKTFEEDLMKLFDPIGPMIGLGKPEDSQRPIGVSRVYVDKVNIEKYIFPRPDDNLKDLCRLLANTDKKDFIPANWHKEVVRRIKKAAIVLVSYDTTKGTENEVNYLLKSREAPPEKILFLFRDAERWNQFQKNFGDPFGHSVSEIQEQVQYLGFFKNGRPNVISYYPESVKKNVNSDYYSAPEIDQNKLNKFIDERKNPKSFSFRFYIERFINF